jgi:asparagine synthase (glutamine-hydrolysing)
VILGVWDKNRTGSELKADLLRAGARLASGKWNASVRAWHERHVAFCWVASKIDSLDEASQPFANRDQTIVSVFDGKIYNAAEIGGALGPGYVFDKARSGEALGYLYERYGERFLNWVNGKFAFALWDERNQKLLLGRDRLGVEPLYYFKDCNRLIFSSSLRALLATGWIRTQLNHDAVLRYLVYCYNPSKETFLRDVYQLPAGHLLSLNDSATSIKRYWRLSFSEIEIRNEKQYREEILGLIEDAVRIRLDSDRSPGVLLSGGTDSSTIVNIAARISSKPVSTFSFRCEGRSYDESHYARLVARRYGTEHTEIPYNPDQLPLISKAVESMDEPLCDIGIEIGTFLLGQAAQDKVSYVFSGEGGDELFGGHPVYVADKVASLLDRFPRVLTGPVIRMLQTIPDSDQKKNFQVKLKRFSYSLSFPPELLSHRWRAYYTPGELQELCTEDWLAYCDMQQLFEGMFRYSSETNGWEPLSRSLYSDYHTLVDFYLRRLGLLRAFFVESRLPLLDYRLVEYAAKIPSRMKVRGISNTKYIYKKVLEGVLPREILYDRPKLGHSVPMKNWLREDAKLQKWAMEVLSESSLVKRGFFRSSSVHRLFEEHLSMRHNHSHRLWALVVLELWLRAWLDPQTASGRRQEYNVLDSSLPVV